ncbi:glycoside hydrolase family 113 [Bdellovibrio sp. HCB209]|uniref:glycoside hydrolase family 113 n=1 Tax=Bdellovibrio sp. HCB209 TaxID=3394354 RepID=UPI0039B42FF0
MNFAKLVLGFLLLFSVQSFAAGKYVSGFNLTESDGFLYDAAAAGQPKTLAQQAVDEAKRLGSNHIILNVRATMKGPYSSEIVPVTAPAERSKEAMRIAKLIKYVQSQGMTVGLRPIFFVVGPNGEFPYIEKMADGSEKTWWHGNIQPKDPNRWFESFRVYLDVYLTVAKLAKVDEFTIGAELYSMTVGIEDQWKEYPYGFPGRWLELLRYVRTKLPTARLMYDVNFTDDSVNSGGISASGGEFERWRYRLVDLADRQNPEEQKIWADLASFWKELDAIGLDIYRSLASNGQQLPTAYGDLVSVLRLRADSYATQLDTGLTQIELTLDHHKPAIIKEIGFRSVDRGFIDPFAYAGSGTVNIQDQAAAFQAIFEAFWQPQWPWFKGILFWDIAIDPSKKGKGDNGFSPLGKEATEKVIKDHYFKNK